VAGWETCPCGRGLPLLRKVVGRQLDILRTPDGRLIPGEFFPHLLKDFHAVRRFQVVQERPDCVRLRFVADAMWSDATRDRLTALIVRQLGPCVRLEMEKVSEISLSPAGKLQVVVNKTPYRKAG
jgi:phenylacetate-CoA ligase